MDAIDAATAHTILSAWMRQEHRGARGRRAVSFRAAADMQDLWKAILRQRAAYIGTSVKAAAASVIRSPSKMPGSAAIREARS